MWPTALNKLSARWVADFHLLTCALPRSACSTSTNHAPPTTHHHLTATAHRHCCCRMVLLAELRSAQTARCGLMVVRRRATRQRYLVAAIHRPYHPSCQTRSPAWPPSCSPCPCLTCPPSICVDAQHHGGGPLQPWPPGPAALRPGQVKVTCAPYLHAFAEASGSLQV